MPDDEYPSEDPQTDFYSDDQYKEVGEEIDIVSDKDAEEILSDDLAKEQAKYDERLQKQEKKKRIRETKRKIRRLKYAPVFETAEALKEAGGSVVSSIGDVAGKIKEKRGTPEERAVKREKIKKTFSKFRKGTKRMMTSSSAGSDQPSRFFTETGGGDSNVFGTGSSPKILQSDFGSKLLSGNILESKQSKGKKKDVDFGFGSGLMSGDILKSATGKKGKNKGNKGFLI